MPAKLHVHYDNHPDRPVATIVFLHGLGTNSSDFDELLADLSADSRFAQTRAVALDLSGFGQSPADGSFGYSAAEQAAAVHATLAQLKTTPPLVLVGHSLGGLIALEYAKLYKVFGLILAAPPLFLPSQQKSLLNKKLDFPAPAKFLEKTPALIRSLAGQPACHISMQNIVLKGDSWQTINNLKIPIVIIRGQFDSLTLKSSPQSLAQTRPNINFIEIPSGHTINPAMQAETIRQLTLLLQRQSSRSSPIGYRKRQRTENPPSRSTQ
jgi:pimeloyl-ACP methyl ester carboxylesterase